MLQQVQEKEFINENNFRNLNKLREIIMPAIKSVVAKAVFKAGAILLTAKNAAAIRFPDGYLPRGDSVPTWHGLAALPHSNVDWSGVPAEVVRSAAVHITPEIYMPVFNALHTAMSCVPH
jgi:hypothetical protein